LFQLKRHIDGFKERAERKKLGMLRTYKAAFERKWNLDEKGQFKVWNDLHVFICLYGPFSPDDLSPYSRLFERSE
jgi:hypothetical protein